MEWGELFMIEIEGDVGIKGTVRFDGSVIEYFGFGKAEGQRIHISQINKVELGKKGAVLGFGRKRLRMSIYYTQGRKDTYFEDAQIEKVQELAREIEDKITP
jgi:hypothetical protein